MVQSRISPGFTTVDLSKATRAESRSTDPESCIFTSGRSAFASMKCFCAKVAAPTTSNESAAALIAANFFFDFNILFVSLDAGKISGISDPDSYLIGIATPCTFGEWVGRIQSRLRLQALC